MCLRDLCINKIVSVIDNPVLDTDGLLLRMVQPTTIELYKSIKVVCMQSHLYFVFLICSPGWLIRPKILFGGPGQWHQVTVSSQTEDHPDGDWNSTEFCVPVLAIGVMANCQLEEIRNHHGNTTPGVSMGVFPGIFN